MEWYYARGEERVGPIDQAALDRLAAEGTIAGDTLVWRDGMDDWQPLALLTSVGDPDPDDMAPVPDALQLCAECGHAFPDGEMIQYEQYRVCGDCKEVFFQRIREGGGIPADLNYAGFWVRFGARIVDGVITNIAVYGLAFVVGFTGGVIGSGDDPQTAEAIAAMSGLAGGLIGLFLPLAYEVYFVGRFGATPGKMTLGLKVVRSDGSPLGYGRATGRYFGLWLSYLTLCIGFIMAGFDAEKRALHDHICDTRVIGGSD